MTRFLRVGLVAAAILITVLDLFGYEDYSRFPHTGIHHNNLVFQHIEKDSPNYNLGIKQGDLIIAVDGHIIRNLNHFNYLTFMNGEPGRQVYTIARGDSLFDVEVESVSPPHSKLYQRFALSLTAFTFILVGVIVILKRPDILGTLFTTNCLIIAFLLTVRPITSIPFFHIAGELIYDGLFLFLPAFFLHFFMIFPGKEIYQGTRRFFIRKIIYIVPSVLFVILFVLALYRYTTGKGRDLVFLMNGIISIFWFLYMVASPILFIRTYMTSDRVQKIKFRIATIGLFIGIIPVSTVIIVKQFLPTVNIPHDYLSMIFLSFISISFAYTILKHDAFDMRIVFRIGLAFVVLPVVMVTLLYFLSEIIERRFPELLGIRHYLLTIAAVILLFVVFIPAMNGIRKLVDWIFFRNRKIFREKVIEFSRKIQSMRTLDEISVFVSKEICDLFDSEHVHLFLLDDSHNYKLRHSRPADSRIPLTSFPPGTELIKLASEKRLPIMVEFFDKIWINSNLDRISRELISISRASVMVPLIEQDELLGFVLLGRKKSGRPYSGSDADILELIAERSAAAIRNNQLYRMSVEKEKLEKEVHLASKIQERLLPGRPPEMESSSVLGNLRTCHEVGGDFYDIVEFSPEKIGIAVADVSGKGIPASILMTTLQASFRSEASDDRPPAEVLTALNRCLYTRSEPSKFATFFYAVYDDRTGILNYCNAGSFPPIVISADGKIMRLKQGGILIGVEPDPFYGEGIVKLKPGDMVVSYTDGCIDQENEKGEYFSEERFIKILKDNCELSLEALMEKIYTNILSFGSGIVKDDITVILLRRNIRPDL